MGKKHKKLKFPTIHELESNESILDVATAPTKGKRKIGEVHTFLAKGEPKNYTITDYCPNRAAYYLMREDKANGSWFSEAEMKRREKIYADHLKDLHKNDIEDLAADS